MKKILFTIISICVLALNAHAQSVMITNSLTKIHNSSAVVQYNNFFGQWNMPDKDIPFPFAVIRIDLSGDEASVRSAKIKFGFDVGNMHRIESDIRTEPNQILLLVPQEIRNIYLTCGDGCEKQLLYTGRLEPNAVYYCKIEYAKEESNNNADSQLFHELEFLKQQIALINAAKAQEDSARIKEEMAQKEKEELAQKEKEESLLADSLRNANISNLYNDAKDRGLLVSGLTEETFYQLVSTESGLRSFCDYAKKKGAEDLVYEDLEKKVLKDSVNTPVVSSKPETALQYPMEMVRYSKSERKWSGKPDFSCNGVAMSQEELEGFLKNNCTKAYKKYVRSSGLRGGGWFLFLAGLAAGGTGAYFYFTEGTNSSTNSYYQVPKRDIIGKSLMIGGAGLSFVIGLPMLSAGHYKANHIDKIYNKQCGNNAPKMTLNLQTSHDGIGLAFKF